MESQTLPEQQRLRKDTMDIDAHERLSDIVAVQASGVQ